MANQERIISQLFQRQKTILLAKLYYVSKLIEKKTNPKPQKHPNTLPPKKKNPNKTHTENTNKPQHKTTNHKQNKLKPNWDNCVV